MKSFTLSIALFVLLVPLLHAKEAETVQPEPSPLLEEPVPARAPLSPGKKGGKRPDRRDAFPDSICDTCVREGRICPSQCCTKNWYKCSNKLRCCTRGWNCVNWKYGKRCEPCVKNWYRCDRGNPYCCNGWKCVNWRWGRRCEPR